LTEQCCFCGDKEKDLSRDHIIPVLFGGVGGPIRLLCVDCNSRRQHNISVDEWNMMSDLQKLIFWDWLRMTVRRRLANAQLPLHQRSDGESLLEAIQFSDFPDIINLLKVNSIPGFKGDERKAALP